MQLKKKAVNFTVFMKMLIVINYYKINSNLIKLFILLLLSFFIMNLENSYYIIIHRSFMKKNKFNELLYFF